MRYIIDRFEGDWAVCEIHDGNNNDVETVNIEKVKIPKGCKSGDVICETADGKYIIDKEESERLKQEAEALYKKALDNSK